VSDPEILDRIERLDELFDLLLCNFGLLARGLVRLRKSLGSLAISGLSSFVGQLLRVDSKII
jgi:hypothetical protein